MQGCSAVCFDLFSTLVCVGDVPESVGCYTADILGLDREAWNAVCFSDAHEICRPTEDVDIIRTLAHHLDPTITTEKIHQAVSHRQARFDYALRHVKPSILDALKVLKRAGLRLALVSNASTSEVAAWQDSPLAPLFDIALFSCECGVKKPEPEIYHLAIHHLDCPATDCMYVGDGGSQEFLGAARVGMRTLLTREFLSSKRYQKVVYEQGEVIGGELSSIPALLKYLGINTGTGESGPGYRF